MIQNKAKKNTQGTFSDVLPSPDILLFLQVALGKTKYGSKDTPTIKIASLLVYISQAMGTI